MLSQILAHKETDVTAPLDYAPARLRIVIDSRQEMSMRANSCAKEPETIAWLERHIKPGDVFYDVGACIGAYSLVAAHLGSAVYAFEPSAHNYRQLVRNVCLNDMRQIRALPLGIGAKSAIRYMNLSSGETGAASHGVSDFASGPLAQAFLEKSLDDLIERTYIRPPTLMKIDVDGGEEAVLIGAAATLRHPGLRSVQIEASDESQEAVREHMERAGFFEADRHQRLGGAPLWNIEYAREAS